MEINKEFNDDILVLVPAFNEVKNIILLNLLENTLIIFWL